MATDQNNPTSFARVVQTMATATSTGTAPDADVIRLLTTISLSHRGTIARLESENADLKGQLQLKEEQMKNLIADFDSKLKNITDLCAQLQVIAEKK